MKKILCLLGTILISFSLFMNKTLAYTFEVSATSYSVTEGNTVTLNIKVGDAAGKFNISSSDGSIVSVSTGSVWIDNTTQSVTLSAKKAGSATIYVNANDVTTYSGDNVNITKQVKITVNAKPSGGNGGGGTYTPRAKSSNNFLSSLTIDGLKLKEDFDKEKLEYSLDVPAETEKIKINAQLADSSASVTGTGEKTLTTGLNTFEIVVTAENGSKRTYVIKATLLELEPIKVTVGSGEYNLIRKRNELPKISEYNTEKEITIGEDKIEGYHNDKLNYDLVGLKDKDGNINYYIYDNGKYTLYNEQTFNGTVLQILDKEIKGSKKTTFTYNDTKIDGYQEVKLDLIKNTYALDDNEIKGNQFYLFYAINVETGKENLYQYDAQEKTVQRYNLEVLDVYKNSSNTYYKYLLLCLLVIGVLIFTLVLTLASKKNKPEKKAKKKTKKEEE